ncbi:MAG: hypothetical protein IT182_09710 [Acidobacteria bacterium]|nr:hypothetical protein [Acidobacteriota bacterium]
MRTRRILTAGLLAVAILALHSGAAFAQKAAATAAAERNVTGGTATLGSERLTYTAGVAWFDRYDDSDDRITIAFFDRTPTPAMRKSRDAADEAPGRLVLHLKRGAPLTIASVTFCFVGADFPVDGAIGNNADARGCGLAVLSGTAKPGGTVTAQLKGTGPGKPWTWDLRVNLPIEP